MASQLRSKLRMNPGRPGSIERPFGVTASMPADSALWSRVAQYNQEQVLRWWDELDGAERDRLRAEIASIDLGQLSALIAEHVHDRSEFSLGFDPSEARPPKVYRLPRTDGERSGRRQVAERGAGMLENGQVAVVMVAGGQGSRLGFSGPKGCYPIAPISHASLFQIHAEKILALSRRHGREIPLYIMTSPDNDQQTREFWSDHNMFGLPAVRFFTQTQMPAVDGATGKILLAEKGRIALSPSGHGGALKALAAKGADGRSCIDDMIDRGAKTIFYFQVDNPMVKIADPAFLGLHAEAKAEVSFKVIEKLQPDEKLGLVVEVNGSPRVIEYSDLPAEMARERDIDGALAHWAGSIAVHLFEVSFLNRLAEEGRELPFHRAIKKVAYVDASGAIVEPAAPNAVKFESFIFDALPLARTYALVETDRSVEFEPLKNRSGPDSPESVRRRMSDQFAAWLEAAGASVPRSADGAPLFAIEISPLYALDSRELKSKVPQRFEVNGPLLLGGESGRPG